jgi:hypothetical protein
MQRKMNCWKDYVLFAKSLNALSIAWVFARGLSIKNAERNSKMKDTNLLIVSQENWIFFSFQWIMRLSKISLIPLGPALTVTVTLLHVWYVKTKDFTMVLNIRKTKSPNRRSNLKKYKIFLKLSRERMKWPNVQLQTALSTSIQNALNSMT